MAKRTTSVAFDDESELLELKSDATEAGMDVSKYLRKLAKDKRQNVPKAISVKKEEPKPVLPEIKTEVVPKREKRKMSDEEIETKVRQIQKEDKFGDKIDGLCKDMECMKKDLHDMKEAYDDCPSCHRKTLKKGLKYPQYCSDCGGGPFAEE